jgi:hypothetical protein
MLGSIFFWGGGGGGGRQENIYLLFKTKLECGLTPTSIDLPLQTIPYHGETSNSKHLFIVYTYGTLTASP